MSEKKIATDREPAFTRGQLLASKRLGCPPDVAAAVLKDGKAYTMEQARRLVSDFLERKVK